MRVKRTLKHFVGCLRLRQFLYQIWKVNNAALLIICPRCIVLLLLATMHVVLFLLFISLLASATGQTCPATDFVLSNGGVEYLKINASNGFYACGGKDVCAALAVPAPTLTLDGSGSLSISGGNSVQLPDISNTNEIQTISLNSGTVSLSSGEQL